MVESTDKFAAAITQAYREREAQGLTGDDRKYVGSIIGQPIQTDRHGRPFFAMRRLHAKVRTMYFVEKRQSWNTAIDWDTLVQWIKDHWLQILQAAAAILSILMFI